MTFTRLTATIPGLRHIADSLEIMSAPGRAHLNALEMTADTGVLAGRLDKAGKTVVAVSDPAAAGPLARLLHVLMCVNDISGTLRRLAAGHVADDTELFELKTFALQCGDISRYCAEMDLDAVAIPDMTATVAILDPDGARIPHFFIYDSYDPRLAPLRRRINACDAGSEEAAALFAEATAVEDEVRSALAARLRPLAPMAIEALAAIGELDFLIAHAKLAVAQGLCRPCIADDGDTCYTALFNPQVREALRRRKRDFQPIDISVGEGVCVVTGANMGGKSVILKTLALAQTLAQLGLYVPASRASVTVVEEVRVCLGDDQSELTGLSSFAAEMLRIDSALKEASSGRRLLVLIDEPGRTTNPEEGRAIAGAIISCFGTLPSITVVTTHYSGLHASRRLRVRGLSNAADGSIGSIADIPLLMDYSLEEDSAAAAPREALRIAAMLGIDPTLIDSAARFLTLQQSQL